MQTHNEYVTRDEMDARMAELELRIADRIGGLERRMDEHFKGQTRWVVSLIVPLYGVMILGFAGLFYFLLNYTHASPGG